jgi:hypothetical protein
MIRGGNEEESMARQFESLEGGTGARCSGGGLAVGGGRRRTWAGHEGHQKKMILGHKEKLG